MRVRANVTERKRIACRTIFRFWIRFELTSSICWLNGLLIKKLIFNYLFIIEENDRKNETTHEIEIEVYWSIASRSRNKKKWWKMTERTNLSQWTSDQLISISIYSILFAIFLLFSINSTRSQIEEFQNIKKEADVSALMYYLLNGLARVCERVCALSKQ